jgi:mannose-6-phosphate isomerase-like protein (cupin superfamily)
MTPFTPTAALRSGRNTMGRHVTDEASAEARRDDGDTATTRVTIGPGFGCEALEQRVIRFAPGRSRPHGGGSREELLFAVAGSGALQLDGSEHVLEPETGVVVPPGGRYQIDNPGPDELVVVSVLALEPEDEPDRRPEPVAVRVAEQEPHPAGKDREFRYVANEEVGCRTVTQFVGSIPPGRAKPHYHTYEEVAYILSGEGVLHMGGESSTVRPGSCIHFPPREPHILENVGSKTLRVLGVFHPAGDPSMAYNVPEAQQEEESG